MEIGWTEGGGISLWAVLIVILVFIVFIDTTCFIADCTWCQEPEDTDQFYIYKVSGLCIWGFVSIVDLIEVFH
jgi:hypothetical protein